MIELIKLGTFFQIVFISAISSIATLIFKHSNKRITKKHIYTFNVLFNLVLILIENLILCSWYGSLLLIFDLWAIMQLLVYWYGCICVSQLFYDKIKEICKELEINLSVEILVYKTKEKVKELKEKLTQCHTIMRSGDVKNE